MLKLGEYEEPEAKDLAGYLRSLNIRFEMRPSIKAEVMTSDILTGRASEVKEIIENFEEVERYLDALRATVTECQTMKELRERYLGLLYPELKSDGDIISCERTLIEGVDGDQIGEELPKEEQTDGNLSGEDQADGYLEDEELSGDEFDDDDLSDDDLDEEDIIRVIRAFKAVEIAASIIHLNDIEMGDRGALAKLEDPIVSVPITVEEGDELPPMANRVISVDLEKVYDIYVDEVSLAFSGIRSELYEEVFHDEQFMMYSVSQMVESLMENPSKRKIRMEEFTDECCSRTKLDRGTLVVDGSSVAEDIAKVLEKNGIIKMKAGWIKWK
ncbi:MAG: hypothetical protein JW986_09310 [Methanotrichaceae archaeon]|nr:hypothetical protein [Methanotrichaceae archaeon]